ncbi:MAG TPA: glycerol kinase GlpK [Azospirillaceae bacterium]|nr:glycerol kinase GlpK [Azospirillaceae bacterium]
MSGKGDCVLAIDQGTTSSRAIVFDAQAGIVAVAQAEFPQHYPADGWVEHDPEDIWRTTLEVSRQAFHAAENKGCRVAAIGITNQRETALVWERATGRPIHNAIVWQDRRTAATCRALVEAGHEAEVQARTGLLLDPYFSATKIAWMLDHVSGARMRAEQGDLAFGTVDTFLLWRLTGGKVHATDATNASRTNLFNIHTQEWDPELLRLFKVPASVLPEVKDCADRFGETDPSLFGRAVPVLGMVGDQQGATIGQCCFEPGMIKSTYGTGCFAVVNTGANAVTSKNRLLGTVAYRLDGKVTYALEGSIFVAGAAVQWLRDGIGVIRSAAETEALAAGLPDNGGVYLVPAFTGLGAPHWDPDARGTIVGLTRGSGRAHLVRAALEACCYQTHDLLAAMREDGAAPQALRVDGGMVANGWMLQFLADVLGMPVDRPKVMETTALGAAYLAGREAGIYGGFEEFTRTWQRDSRFTPAMPAASREGLLAGWSRAVGRTLG